MSDPLVELIELLAEGWDLLNADESGPDSGSRSSDSPVSGASKKAANLLAAAKAKEALAAAAKLEVERARVQQATELEEMRLVQERQKLAEWKCADAFQHTYYFFDMVSEATAEKCMANLDLWDRLDPMCDMTIIFNSPGGDVIAGLALFDHIQMLRRKGHCITTVTEGMAASMAGILLQAGTQRIMGKEAWVLIHEAAFGTSGKTFQVEDRVEWVKRVQERILDIFAERAKGAGEAGTASHPLSRAGFKKNWNRKDWWLSSDECLKYGIVDAIQ